MSEYSSIAPTPEPKGEHTPLHEGNNRFPPSTGRGFKKRSQKWPWILALLVGVLIIAGATLGGVFGSRAADKDNNADGGNGSDGGGTAAGSAATASKTKGSANGAIVPTGTDAFGNPLYPSTTGSAVISAPTTVSNAALSCGSDPYDFGNITVRSEHPLLWAPAYKWDCLPSLIALDSYMASWNATIFANATKFYALSPTNYSIDGGLAGSGVLDVAREVQLRIKHWGYAWKMTNDTKWLDRTWLEVQTAAGNNSDQYFGTTGDNWNSQHFLDIGEFATAFAIAYDWFYDAWTDSQREAIRWSITNLALSYGLNAYAEPTGAGANYTWWRLVNGNWNCVCNKGLMLGALAIYHDDTTGIAAKILSYTIPNTIANCAESSSNDGSWSETQAYWYFGTYSFTEMALALITATGSSQNLLDSNPGVALSGDFHMYGTGMQGRFLYGDSGPNQYTATANGMMLYGSYFNKPEYTLFQRDQGDAPEPMSMLYYDPQVSGDFWDGLALDHHFDNVTDAWVSMRSSWTTTDGTYLAMKCGALLGHQTHGDLDGGDFVLDALGQRWAGEYGNGNYLADGYFSSEAQNSERWDYYRKRTEGQNTLLMGGLDQNVAAVPTTTFGSTGDTQTALDYTAANSSTAYFTCNMTDMYNGTSTLRAIRFLNGRRQILLQDDVDVPSIGVQWRMQTNATVALSNNNQTATLTLGSGNAAATMVVELLSPSTAVFGTAEPVRLSTDPTVPADAESKDQPNPGVTVLTIDIPTGQQSLQVLFNPQWPGWSANSFVTPPSVAVTSWTTASHE